MVMLDPGNKIYTEGIKTLEDLYFLIDPNLEPLLEKMLFHFNELKNEAELCSVESPIRINKLHNISKSFDKYIKDKVKDYLLLNKSLYQINYTSKGDDLNFFKWDKLIYITKEIFEVLDLFELKDKFDFRIDSKGIKGVGFLSEDFNFNKIRLALKEKIKFFAKNKILLSFNLDESVYDNLLVFKLFFDFSHDDNFVYEINIENSNDEKLVFSNVLENYKVDYSFLENLRKTVYLEITDDLRLKRFNYIPSYIKNNSSDKEFYHFHFLFHSISLIIPKKGKVLPSRNNNPLDERSGKYFDENGIYKIRGKKKDKLIDLFSLISK